MSAPALAEFAELLRSSLVQGSFASLVLANHRGSDTSLQRVIGRRIRLRDEWMLSLLYRHKTRDLTRNFSIDIGVAEVLAALDSGADGHFGHAHLATQTDSVDLRISKKVSGR